RGDARAAADARGRRAGARQARAERGRDRAARGVVEALCGVERSLLELAARSKQLAVAASCKLQAASFYESNIRKHTSKPGHGPHRHFGRLGAEAARLR